MREGEETLDLSIRVLSFSNLLFYPLIIISKNK